MAKKDKTGGPKSGSRGLRDLKGQGKGSTGGEGIGKKKSGEKRNGKNYL